MSVAVPIPRHVAEALMSDEFAARVGIASAPATAMRIVKRSGHWEALVDHLRCHPEFADGVAAEVERLAAEPATPGYIHDSDVPILALTMALAEVGAAATSRARKVILSGSGLVWSRPFALSLPDTAETPAA